MKTLTIIIEDKQIPVNLPDSVIESGRSAFEQMDADMDRGWQMSRVWVDHPDDIQRCQIVADRLLTAVEQANEASTGLMSAYILNRLSNVSAVNIDISGDMTETRFEFAD